MGTGIKNPGQYNPWGNSGDSSNPFGGDTGGIFNKAKGDILNGNDNNPNLKSEVEQYENQLKQLGIKRQMMQMQGLATIGDLQNKIFQNQRAIINQQAQSGISNQMIAQKQLNNQEQVSQNKFENSYISGLSSNNIEAGLEQKAEDLAMAGSQSVAKEFDKYLQGKNFNAGRTHDDSGFSHFFKTLFGYKSATSQGIDFDKLKKDKAMMQMMKNLGLDINDKNTRNLLNKFNHGNTEQAGVEEGFPETILDYF